MTTETTQQESSLSEDIAANLVTDEPLEETAAPEVEETAELAEILEALEPPTKWNKRYKEVFNSWGQANEDGTPLYETGRDWQQAMIDQWKETQGYITQIEQDRAGIRSQLDQASGYRQQWEQALSPYQQMLVESGVQPPAAAAQALGLMASLRNNPQATLMRLAQQMNVDLKSALDGQEWVDPQVAQANKRIESLERHLRQREQAQSQQRQQYMAMQAQHLRAENAKQIQTFAEAKGEDGELLHPHLETVQGTMAQLIHGREAQRRTDPSIPRMELDEAYSQACLLNEDVQKSIQDKRDKQEAIAKMAEAKKSKDAARKPKSGATGNTKPDRSLRDEIKANLVTA